MKLNNQKKYLLLINHIQIWSIFEDIDNSIGRRWIVDYQWDLIDKNAECDCTRYVIKNDELSRSINVTLISQNFKIK